MYVLNLGMDLHMYKLKSEIYRSRNQFEPKNAECHFCHQHPPPDKLATWLTQAGSGMAQLETEGIIHRNLRCRSLLIAEDDKCKLSDYGWGTKEDIQKSTVSVLKYET